MNSKPLIRHQLWPCQFYQLLFFMDDHSPLHSERSTMEHYSHTCPSLSIHSKCSTMDDYNRILFTTNVQRWKIIVVASSQLFNDGQL